VELRTADGTATSTRRPASPAAEELAISFKGLPKAAADGWRLDREARQCRQGFPMPMDRPAFPKP